MKGIHPGLEGTIVYNNHRVSKVVQRDNSVNGWICKTNSLKVTALTGSVLWLRLFERGFNEHDHIMRKRDFCIRSAILGSGQLVGVWWLVSLDELIQGGCSAISGFYFDWNELYSCLHNFSIIYDLPTWRAHVTKRHLASFSVWRCFFHCRRSSYIFLLST